MKRIFIATLLCAPALFAAPAQAVIVQQVYTGTVFTGGDFAGVFGPASTDLAGKSFTATFRFDTDAGNTTTGTAIPSDGTFILLAGGTSPSDPYFNTPSPLISATLSIGGSGAVPIAGGSEDNTSIRSFPVPGLAPSEYLSRTFGGNGDFLSVFVRSFTSSYPADLTAVGTYLTSAGASTGDQFRIVDALTFSDKARGSLTTEKLVVSLVTPDTSETPLPATLPLFAGGLGVIGLVLARRRRTHAEG